MLSPPSSLPAPTLMLKSAKPQRRSVPVKVKSETEERLCDVDHSLCTTETTVSTKPSETSQVSISAQCPPSVSSNSPQGVTLVDSSSSPRAPLTPSTPNTEHSQRRPLLESTNSHNQSWVTLMLFVLSTLTKSKPLLPQPSLDHPRDSLTRTHLTT